MSCAGCGELSGHPHTVRASRVPLYQLGWLGDTYDITDLGPPVDTPTIDAVLTYPSPDQPSYQDMILNPNAYPDIFTPTNPNRQVVYGPPAAGQPGGIPVTAISSIASLFSKLFGSPSSTSTLPPGPSPRVSTPGIFGSTASLSSFLPIAAIGIVGIVLLTGGKRR